MVTLKVALVSGPQYDGLYKRLADFQSQTGHSVEIIYAGSHPALNDYLATTFPSSSSSSSTTAATTALPPPELDLISTHIKYAPSQTHFLLPLSLTDIPQSYRDQFLPSALKSCFYHQQLIQLPRSIDCRVFFYRSDILSELNLSPPTSWQQVETVARTVYEQTNGQIQGYVFPGTMSGLFGTFYELALMNMETETDDDANDGEQLFDQNGQVVFSESLVKRVLESMHRMYKTRAVPENIEELYFDEVSEMFTNGQVAMVADWPAFFGSMKNGISQQPRFTSTGETQTTATTTVAASAAATATVGVMRYPTGTNRSHPRAAYSGMHSFAIPTSCRHHSEAIELLKFLTADEQQWLEASESGAYPAKSKVLQQLKDKVALEGSTLDKERLECLAETIRTDMAMFPKMTNYPELEDALYPIIQDAIVGRVECQEAAKRMRQRALEICPRNSNQ